jgi:putative hydrolase of the HAD superfamily
MSPDPRAVVFDLDDTLYPYRRFVRSGLVAVAVHLEHAYGINGRWAARWLLRASRGADRGRELQACLAVLRLSPGLLPALLHILRAHQPSMRLPRVSARALGTLRAEGWRLGVLTNGSPSIQARKVAALGLAAAVDVVVYAAEHGSGAGKPEPEPFAEIARRLGVSAARIVFVGDDARADMAGAMRAGMHAVQCAAWTDVGEPCVADGVIYRLSLVPQLARMLLEEAPSRHAA